MRTLDYLRIGLKDLRQQPIRFCLTVTALVISSLILVTLTTLSLGARQAIIDELSPGNSLSDITVTPTQGVGSGGLFGNVQESSANTSKLTDQSVASIAAILHVQFAVPEAYVWEFNTFQVAGTTKQFITQTYGIAEANTSDLPLAVGHEFNATATANQVIVGAGYAQALGISPDSRHLLGRVITITTQPGYRGVGATIPGPEATQAQNDQFNQTPTTLTATIVGVTTTGGNQNNLFIPMGWAHQIRTIQSWAYDPAKAAHVADPATAPADQIADFKTVDQITENGYSNIFVKVDSPDNVAAVSTAISRLGFGEISTESVLKQIMSFATVMWVILGAVALVSLLAAGLGIVNTMLMVVSEQRYIIGVWRACGAPKSQITRQFLLQAALLGLTGGVLGAGAGFGISYYVNQRIVSLLQARHLLSAQLPNAPWWLLAGSVALTILFSLLAGLYPAAKAARQDPSRALAAGQ